MGRHGSDIPTGISTLYLADSKYLTARPLPDLKSSEFNKSHDHGTYKQITHKYVLNSQSFIFIL